MPGKRGWLVLIAGGVLVLTLTWGAMQLANRVGGGNDPPNGDARLKVEPDWKDGEVSFFKTPHKDLYLGLIVPEGEEWASGLVKESDNGRSGLPQFVRMKPTAVAYLSVDRMDVPPEIARLTLKEQVLSLAASKRDQWGQRIKDDLQSVASTQNDTEIKVDGQPTSGMIISIYVTKTKDGKPQQYRVSECFTLIHQPPAGEVKTVLVVTLRMEREIEGDGVVTKMSDATRIEKDGKLTFLPVPMGKELDTAWSSFCVATKRP